MDYSLSALSAATDPIQRQQIMAQVLRRSQSDDAISQANQEANKFNVLAAVGAMANNPSIAAATQMAAKQQQDQYKPIHLGTQGFALPATGEFIASPMYQDEKNAQRTQQRLLFQQTMDYRNAELERQRQHDQDNLAMRQMMFGLAQGNQDLRTSLLQNRLDQQGNQAVQKYTNTLQKANIPLITSALDDVGQIMQKYPQGDIPGFGRVENAMPDFMIGAEGRQNRVMMKMAFDQVLKNLSGMGALSSASKRLATALGQNAGMTSDDLRLGYSNLVRDAAKQIGNFNSSLTPQQYQQYLSQGGTDYSDFGNKPWMVHFNQQPGQAKPVSSQPSGVPSAQDLGLPDGFKVIGPAQ